MLQHMVTDPSISPVMQSLLFTIILKKKAL